LLNILLIDQSHLFKFIIVGDPGVGKTALMRRFIENKFTPEYDTTVGIEFGARVINFDADHHVKIQAWDTAGQEVYRSITRAYYRRAAACLIVYDVSRRETFLNVKRWMKEVELYSSFPSLTLVAAKMDLPNICRKVSSQEGSKFAQDHGMLFVETAAKAGLHTNDAFTETARSMVSQIQANVFHRWTFQELKNSPGRGCSRNGCGLTSKERPSSCGCG